MDCINKLTANISYDCSPSGRAKAGLETSAVLINKADIDLAALTQSGATVTNLSLNSGATGFKIEWIKQLANSASEFTANESGTDSFTHKFAARVFGQSAGDAERVKELSSGEFVVVVETKFKGTNNIDAYKVFGLENGLRMSEANQTSLEADGSFIFTLASVANFGESYPFQIYNEGSYSANKARFVAKFA